MAGRLGVSRGGSPRATAPSRASGGAGASATATLPTGRRAQAAEFDRLTGTESGSPEGRAFRSLSNVGQGRVLRVAANASNPQAAVTASRRALRAQLLSGNSNFQQRERVGEIAAAIPRS